jgi:hypothetical protein
MKSVRRAIPGTMGFYAAAFFFIQGCGEDQNDCVLAVSCPSYASSEGNTGGSAATSPCAGVADGHAAIIMEPVLGASGDPAIAGYHVCPSGSACVNSQYKDPLPNCVGTAGQMLVCDVGTVPSGTIVYFIGGWTESSGGQLASFASAVTSMGVKTQGAYDACRGESLVGSFVASSGDTNVPSDFTGALQPSNEVPTKANFMFVVP